jgi:hypothetical protein
VGGTQASDMTRGLLKKLYRKNVDLEKENQLYRVQLGLGEFSRTTGADTVSPEPQPRSCVECALNATTAPCCSNQSLLTLRVVGWLTPRAVPRVGSSGRPSSDNRRHGGTRHHGGGDPNERI